MISQKDQLALHEFSMRMREAVAARSAEKSLNMDSIREAVTEQYHAEKESREQPSVQPAEPSKEPDQPEPEM